MNNYAIKNDYAINSSTATAANMSTPAQNRQPGMPNALFKLAARNLREYHCVPSMTALKLEKTVALLGLPPRRVVEQGLAPRRLLKGDSSPLVLAGESSGEAEEELCETETGDMDEKNVDILIIDNNYADILPVNNYDYNNNNNNNYNYNNYNNNSSSEEEDEEEEEEEVGQDYRLFSDDSDSLDEDVINSINNSNIDDAKDDVKVLEADGSGMSKRPVHTALVAGGINIHPGETRHLLRVLGVSPHRLVRLGLLKREAVRTMPGRRQGDPGQRNHLNAGGARKEGVGRRYGPPHGPPDGHGGPSCDCGPSRPVHDPARPFHRDGHHTMQLGEEGEDEGKPAPLGPHRGSGHRSPLHLGGRLQGPPHGPGHHSMPTVGRGHAPPGGSKHGHGHPPHGHGHGNELAHAPAHGRLCGDLHGESEREERKRLHGAAPGPEQPGPRRRYGGGMGRSRGRPLGPFREGGASGALLSMIGHPRLGSPSRGGGGMKQHDGRRGGEDFCGGSGGDGGHRQHERVAHNGGMTVGVLRPV